LGVGGLDCASFGSASQPEANMRLTTTLSSSSVFNRKRHPGSILIRENIVSPAKSYGILLA
jgi:hypothetical protein